MLPRRIPKPAKRATRWRSQAHCNFVRSHECSVPGCASDTPTEVAHLRVGGGAGMGQKPDDWHTISLCRDCHRMQHAMGERSFARVNNFDVVALAAEFAAKSPRAAEIRTIQHERGL